MRAITELIDIHPETPLIRVFITQVRGSAPRDEGTCMWVSVDSFWGTVGGGHLEWQLLQTARQWLQQILATPSLALDVDLAGRTQQFILGAQLGQCCGGKVQVQMDCLTGADALQHVLQIQQHYEPVGIFGAGHVSLALARQLLLFSYEVMVKDSRDKEFWQIDSALQQSFTKQLWYEQINPIADAVLDLKPNSKVLVLTHNHAEDFEILKACLVRQQKKSDLGSIGLIGSATKWASFSSRLLAMGFTMDDLNKVKCPIGLPAIKGKEPAVIALSVVADWLHSKSS